VGDDGIRGVISFLSYVIARNINFISSYHEAFEFRQGIEKYSRA
jgi:hypothetical protein